VVSLGFLYFIGLLCFEVGSGLLVLLQSGGWGSLIHEQTNTLNQKVVELGSKGRNHAVAEHFSEKVEVRIHLLVQTAV
jgi:hypothetical protein